MSAEDNSLKRRPITAEIHEHNQNLANSINSSYIADKYKDDFPDPDIDSKLQQILCKKVLLIQPSYFGDIAYILASNKYNNNNKDYNNSNSSSYSNRVSERDKDINSKIKVESTHSDLQNFLRNTKPTFPDFSNGKDNENKKVVEKEKDVSVIKKEAIDEFNCLVDLLKQKGIEVQVYPQVSQDASDSVFPANWISTHKNSNIPGNTIFF